MDDDKKKIEEERKAMVAATMHVAADKVRITEEKKALMEERRVLEEEKASVSAEIEAVKAARSELEARRAAVLEQASNLESLNHGDNEGNKGDKGDGAKEEREGDDEDKDNVVKKQSVDGEEGSGSEKDVGVKKTSGRRQSNENEVTALLEQLRREVSAAQAEREAVAKTMMKLEEDARQIEEERNLLEAAQQALAQEKGRLIGDDSLYSAAVRERDELKREKEELEKKYNELSTQKMDLVELEAEKTRLRLEKEALKKEREMNAALASSIENEKSLTQAAWTVLEQERNKLRSSPTMEEQKTSHNSYGQSNGRAHSRSGSISSVDSPSYASSGRRGRSTSPTSPNTSLLDHGVSDFVHSGVFDAIASKDIDELRDAFRIAGKQLDLKVRTASGLTAAEFAHAVDFEEGEHCIRAMQLLLRRPVKRWSEKDVETWLRGFCLSPTPTVLYQFQDEGLCVGSFVLSKDFAQSIQHMKVKASELHVIRNAVEDLAVMNRIHHQQE